MENKEKKGYEVNLEPRGKDNSNKSIIVLLVVIVILILLIFAIDLVTKRVDINGLFDKTVNYTTEKEVTVTDEGIADAVEKVYNATVIVQIIERGEVAGWGSGFVYKTDTKYAYILTNHHVVEDTSEIRVVMTDDTEVEAKVLGSDEYNDVAVLRIDADKVLAVAEIGKTEGLRLGDTVFAVGTPVGLEYSFTVTRGILSGADRMVAMTKTSNSGYFGYQQVVDSWYINLLQIDAPINSGNSGGPLANSNGEVIGINNSKLSSSYSSTSIENMGFAIPIEDALAVASQIEENGKVERPVLGISMTSVENASKSGINIPKDVTSGAVIASVEADSLADRSGLKKADVVIKLGDYEIKDYKYLKYYLFRHKVGDKVKIVILRNGKEKTITMKLES